MAVCNGLCCAEKEFSMPVAVNLPRTNIFVIIFRQNKDAMKVNVLEFAAWLRF